MATKFEKPSASQETPLEAMPPVTVTTQDIPEAEHIEVPPVAGALEPTRERRGRTLVWALAGVVGALLIVGIGVLTYALRDTTATPLHMGLTTQAWQEYRAGERASTTPYLNGLTLPAWQAYRGGEVASAAVSGPYTVPGDAWSAYRAGERSAVYPVGHMGLSGPVWREFRTGERMSTSPLHMGLTTQAWQEYRAGERTA
jgi:hypothetical protein